MIYFCILYLELSADVNQSQLTVATQNIILIEEAPSDTKTVTEVPQYVTDENIEEADDQKGTEELSGILLNTVSNVNENTDCIMIIYVAI